MNKKSTLNTIALAAAAVLLSGTFAVAGEFANLEPRDDRGGSTQGQAVSAHATPGLLANFSQNAGVTRPDGRRLERKPRPVPAIDPAPAPGRIAFRQLGLCVVAPLQGRVVCWGVN